MRSRNRFNRGSGCYECRVCGKQTRETGHDESSCQLCAFCYEESGLENHHSDNGGCEPYNPACPICNEDRDSQIKALCRDYGVQPPKAKLIDQLAAKLYEETEKPEEPLINRLMAGEFKGEKPEVVRVAVEAQQGTADHPKAQRLWELAWEHGHANGYTEVYFWYVELKTLID